MKKIIVITDGLNLRAFRISDHQQDSDLKIHYREIRSTDLGNAAVDESDRGQLSRIAALVSQIMAEEEPVFWNLVAPENLLDPLLRELSGKLVQGMARAVSDDLIGASLSDIALRFPPMPCRQWSPSGLLDESATGVRPAPGAGDSEAAVSATPCRWSTQAGLPTRACASG